MEKNVKKDSILTGLQEAFRQLIDELQMVEEKIFNRPPYEGAWSPARIGRHLIKSYAGLPEMLTAPVRETERDPVKNVEQIKKDFCDFTIKMQSPEFIVPEEKVYDKDQLIGKLRSATSAIISSAKEMDLSLTCTGFEFPGYGLLTRWEWLHFLVFHTQRHIHQLKKFHGMLQKNN